MKRTGLECFQLNLRARGNRQASGNRNQAHVSKCQGSGAVGPTFCNVKADTAVNEVFPE